jgi:5'-nucleotidase
MIIGGHSHTILDQPAEVNDVLIAQAGTGTDQIGRFDIVVDDDTNSIVEWTWQLIPVDDDLAEPDADLQRFIDSFKEVVDRKYNRILCRLARKLTHPKREEETALGNLVADIFAERSGTDLMLLGSGAIRGWELGPLVTLGDLLKAYPYDGVLLKLTVTGAQITGIFEYIMEPENRHEDGHVYQVSGSVQAVYDDAARQVETLTLNGHPVQADAHYTLCISEYHYKSSDKALNLTNEELTALGEPRTVTTSTQDVLEEYLSTHQNLNRQVEGRLVYK